MFIQISSKTATILISFYTLMILLVSYLTSGSLNPLDAYATQNVLSKILIIILSVSIFGTFLTMLFTFSMKKMITIKSGKRAEDVICPGCGLPLLQYAGSHGDPILCPVCQKFWHNGPVCYNKGMPRPKIALPTYPCPICRYSVSKDDDLFDDGF